MDKGKEKKESNDRKKLSKELEKILDTSAPVQKKSLLKTTKKPDPVRKAIDVQEVPELPETKATGGSEKKKTNPYDYYGLKPDLPNKSIVPTPDGNKWECYDKKWYKIPELGNFGKLEADDSIIVVDPINILPAEKCTCGRPKTEFEKNGVYTYGDYLKKCCIRGRTINPYGRIIKFSDNTDGLALILKNYEHPSDNKVSIVYKKRSQQRVGDVTIRL